MGVPASTTFRLWTACRITTVLACSALAALLLPAVPVAAEPAAVGYRDFSYAASGVNDPTGEKPQSKLWHADGSWWGALFDRTTEAHHIYRLDAATQTWLDTGVELDGRNSARLDVLWSGGKLYVVGAGPKATTASHRVEIRRYSYDAGSDTYTRDPGFPVTIVDGGVEAAVMDRDSLGRLWVTWTRDNSAWVAHSTTSDATWTAPFVVPVAGATTLTPDDISAVVSYDDKVGVMWSNQNDGTMYFASHVDGAPDTEWTANPAVQAPGYADDHISLRSLSADDAGRVYAVTKTGLTGSGSPLILVLRLSPQGSWSRATFGRVTDDHTRPILVVDRQSRKLYVFASAPCCAGGTIYYKESPIDNLAFPDGVGTPFIQGIEDRNVNNPTSTKQEVDSSTGLVVLASDDTTKYYLHNHVPLGGGPSVDVTPPETSITSGPSGTVSASEATFEFSSSEAGSTFECSLDGAVFEVCSSPRAYTGLAAGDHEFRVRATDAAGNTDATPAARSWTVQDAAATTTTTFVAVADARVQEANPNNNYRNGYLSTDAGAGVNVESNLRFDVAGVSGTVQRAVVRVFSTSETVDGPAVYATAGGWTESKLTWATRPARTSGVLADAGAIATGVWTELDVTGVVAGNGTYDLALVTDSLDGIKFLSREGAEPPQLVITTTDSG